MIDISSRFMSNSHCVTRFYFVFLSSFSLTLISSRNTFHQMLHCNIIHIWNSCNIPMFLTFYCPWFKKVNLLRIVSMFWNQFLTDYRIWSSSPYDAAITLPVFRGVCGRMKRNHISANKLSTENTICKIKHITIQ